MEFNLLLFSAFLNLFFLVDGLQSTYKIKYYERTLSEFDGIFGAEKQTETNKIKNLSLTSFIFNKIK